MEVLLRTGGYRLWKQGFQVQSLTCHFALFDTPGGNASIPGLGVFHYRMGMMLQRAVVQFKENVCTEHFSSVWQIVSA